MGVEEARNQNIRKHLPVRKALLRERKRELQAIALAEACADEFLHDHAGLTLVERAALPTDLIDGAEINSQVLSAHY